MLFLSLYWPAGGRVRGGEAVRGEGTHLAEKQIISFGEAEKMRNKKRTLRYFFSLHTLNLSMDWSKGERERQGRKEKTCLGEAEDTRKRVKGRSYCTRYTFLRPGLRKKHE